MRAIIIEEERFTEICDIQEAQAEKLARLEGNAAYEAQRAGTTPEAWAAAVRQVHKMMNLNFVRWAQSHGASCTKR